MILVGIAILLIVLFAVRFPFPLDLVPYVGRGLRLVRVIQRFLTFFKIVIQVVVVVFFIFNHGR